MKSQYQKEIEKLYVMKFDRVKTIESASKAGIREQRLNALEPVAYAAFLIITAFYFLM